MSNDIINPFNEKKIDWAKKSRERLIAATKSPETIATDQSTQANSKGKPSKPGNLERHKHQISQARVAKSFKIYKGELSRNFDKRVNKMQVYFDEMDFDKNYVDSGKYIMFLMAFAEKYGLYELYREVGASGEIDISKQDILNNFAKHLKD